LLCSRKGEFCPEFQKDELKKKKLISILFRHHIIMNIMFCTLMPTIVPIYFWNEDWLYSVLSMGFLRFILILNVTWSVNSVAHLWGNKPYDKYVKTDEPRTVSTTHVFSFFLFVFEIQKNQSS
jgi:stearoyl-CoA desaturase (Delta-9 desaturase)